MRLFVALDIDEAIRQRIAKFMEGVREFAPAARWVRPESLHVTLKFIGERKDDPVEEVSRALEKVQGPAFELSFRGHGFFPTPRSARVFWLGIETGPALTALAKSVDETLSALGIPKEAHAYSPHLTLARGGSGSGAPGRRHDDRPNRAFQRLQEKLAPRPAAEFGTMTAREFFLYQSRLGPQGSTYTKISSFALT